MTTREVIKNAERITVGHIYPDNTILYDIGIGDKAYTVRVHRDDFVRLAQLGKEER